MFEILKDIKKGKEVKTLENNARVPDDISGGKGFDYSALSSAGLLEADSLTHQHSVRARKNQSPPNQPFFPKSFPGRRAFWRIFLAQAGPYLPTFENPEHIWGLGVSQNNINFIFCYKILCQALIDPEI